MKRYLYFKEDGVLILNATRPQDNDGGWPKKLIVPLDYDWRVITDTDKDMPTVREKNYDEIVADQNYSRTRAVNYPDIEDQLDELYHNGIEGWKAKIKEVKDKYPKE